jgi:membrane associated rhomboid family serine protease
MTASSPPITWLTSNYVHEDWDHLAGNVEGFAMCMVIYFALVPVLAVLGVWFALGEGV